jgi:hypothetical protein
MAGKFSRSWDLVKASARVLQADKALMVFPLLSAVSSLAVIASFVIPVLALTGFGRSVEAFQGRHMSPGFYLGMFAFYVVQYFVIIFFNTALVGAALSRLRGGSPTVADGMRVATSRLPTIVGYALISATVGVFLRALQERLGLIGRLVAGFLGFGWTLASFLAVPVLASEDVGPVEAVKRSVELLKRTWGENLIGTTGMGVAFGLLIFVVMLFGALLIAGAVATQSIVLIILTAVSLAIAAVLVALIQAALHGIYSAALYRFAEEGAAGEGFDQTLLEGAFRPKK